MIDNNHMAESLRHLCYERGSQRLGQVLVNLAGEQDLFYLEDEELVTRIRSHIQANIARECK